VINGADGAGQPGTGGIVSPERPQFGDFANAPVMLAHECGHIAGYNCGDFVGPDGKVQKAHSGKKNNIMYPQQGTEEDTNKIKPDKCWCDRMAGN
jgi:hypothetical protein